MHDEPSRLVHHNDVLVFVDHGERNILSEERRLAHWGDNQVQRLSWNQRGAGTNNEAIHGEMAFRDESLHERS
jgi:hypothetical protein